MAVMLTYPIALQTLTIGIYGCIFFQADDDQQPVFVPKPRDLEDAGMKVTRDKLNILMETFYREVEKLRDQALQVCLKKTLQVLGLTWKHKNLVLSSLSAFSIISWHWRCRINRSLSSISNNINYLCNLSFEIENALIPSNLWYKSH